MRTALSASMARHRPIGVTILALSGALGALVSAHHAHQGLGVIPFVLAPLSFYGVDRLGAVLWALGAKIWVWVTVVLRRVKQQGWLFVVLTSAPNVILAGRRIPGASPFRATLPASLLDGAVPRCSLLPGVRDAFRVGSTVT